MVLGLNYWYQIGRSSCLFAGGGRSVSAFTSLSTHVVPARLVQVQPRHALGRHALFHCFGLSLAMQCAEVLGQ